MILVVNLNLVVDQIIEVDGLQPGHVHRSKSTLRQAGGKGVNVRRVLEALGERARQWFGELKSQENSTLPDHEACPIPNRIASTVLCAFPN
jgi:hypothetical protein